MGCSLYRAINEDQPIGFEILRVVGFLGEIFWASGDRVGIKKENSTQVACRLAAPTEKAKFKTLSLGFGLRDNDQYSNGATVRLSIYKDGQFYQYRDIAKGQKLLWPLDVTNTRSLVLEGECIRAENRCPIIYFFLDTLE